MIDDYILGFIVSGIVFTVVLYKYKTAKRNTIAQDGKTDSHGSNGE